MVAGVASGVRSSVVGMPSQKKLGCPCTKNRPNSIATPMQLISTKVADLRPMYCASMPRGKRISAPARMGTDSIRPCCAAVSP